MLILTPPVPEENAQGRLPHAIAGWLGKTLTRLQFVVAAVREAKTVVVSSRVILVGAALGVFGLLSLALASAQVASSPSMAQEMARSRTHELTDSPPPASAGGSPTVQVEQTSADQGDKIGVDVAGAVVHPGIYRLGNDARVADALLAAGGISAEADSYYVSRILNLSTVLMDQQKLYIPTASDSGALAMCRELVLLSGASESEQSGGNSNADQEANDSGSSSIGRISLNDATQSELETLPSVGAKRAQDIITHRPYAAIDDVVTQKVVTQTIFDEIKNLITL